ncbi:MAG: site-specific DNA-methyltransferase [Myxococcales bacterium]|nr:site-specific DNA-methyltransferase [Myxococcales bacterium]
MPRAAAYGNEAEMAKGGIELVWSGKSQRVPRAGEWGDLELAERQQPGATSAQLGLVYAGESDSGGATGSTRAHPGDDGDNRNGDGGVNQADASGNLLVFGDNLVAMEALASRFEGQIDVVYIDPPFATGLSYYSQTQAGEEQVAIERTAYHDGRTGGLGDYLDALYARLTLMHRLLKADGKLFLHCDWRANSMLRLILDELFGPACFRNEIVWRRAPNLGRQAASRQLGRVFDTILVYSKTPGAAFAGVLPRKTHVVALDGNGKPKGARWDADRKAYFTTAPRGDYTDASITELRAQGRVYDSATGTVYIKYFLREDERGAWVKDQPVDALWDDFEVRPLRHRAKSEDMGYDTQKPEGLLERILSWASKPGDLVADFYCGSGTTLAVAARLGRRWIGCDAGLVAIDVTRKRLAAISPFDVVTTARAEQATFLASGGAAAILAAYGAKAFGVRLGVREQCVVAVAEGARVTSGEAEAACQEACRRGLTSVHLLGWSWGEDMAELRACGHAQGLAVELRTIPIELARGARSGLFLPPVELEVSLRRVGDEVAIELARLTCPERKPRGATGVQGLPITALVTTWMVDFRYDGRLFRPGVRFGQRRGEPIELTTPLQRRGRYGTRACVAVTTIFGDSVTRVVELGG